jgi:NifU-like protein involved in Fe-S cluster formation
MGRNVLGSTVAELRTVRDATRRMLKEGGSPPEGRWSDLAALEPVRDFKARHASILLTFDAVVDAIAQIEARGPAASEDVAEKSRRSSAGTDARSPDAASDPIP